MPGRFNLLLLPIMETPETIGQKLKNDNTPFWYLYEPTGKKPFRVSGQTVDIDESVNQLADALVDLPGGTYRLKAADNPNKHNGAQWHDILISLRNPKPAMNANSMSTNAYGIPDHVYNKISEEARQRFMFEDMYNEFKQFRQEWPDFKKRIEKMEKFLTEDADGDGVPDFADTMSKVASAADSANTVRKVFTGSSLFD